MMIHTSAASLLMHSTLLHSCQHPDASREACWQLDRLTLQARWQAGGHLLHAALATESGSAGAATPAPEDELVLACWLACEALMANLEMDDPALPELMLARLQARTEWLAAVACEDRRPAADDSRVVRLRP